MKIIRFGLISILSLFGVITAITFFIPSHIRISRAMNMPLRAESVMQEIGDINQWKNWYPGFDTLTIIPVNLKDGILTEAIISATTTSIVITEKKPGEVVAKFISGKKNPVISGWKTIEYSSKDSLTIQWWLDFELKWYPWEKFLSLTYDKTYGMLMEQGLNNLKKMADGK